MNWAVADEQTRQFLEFNWAERGGPEVLAAGEKGFGFTLISAMGRSLSSAPSIKLNRDGLECNIRVPLETLVPAKSDERMALEMQTLG